MKDEPDREGGVTGVPPGARPALVPLYREERISVMYLAAVLLRHRRLVVALPLVLLVVVIAVVLIRGARYEAVSSFLPQSQQSPLSRYVGLASQFGVSLPDGADTPGESLEFYAELLTSRSILETVAQSEYVVDELGRRNDGGSGNLIDLFDVRGDTESEKLAAAVEQLRTMVSVQPSAASGLVHVETVARWQSLAVSMNRRLLELLSLYNLERRQSQAAAERAFAESRMQDIQVTLRAAESDMQQFLEDNRMYQNSPQLVFEAARLQRRVDQQQQLYLTLVQAFEQARLEEVRSTPVITIIDSPEGSVDRAGPSLILTVLIVLALGGMLGVALALAYDQYRRMQAAYPDDYAEFLTLRRDAVAWFRRK